MAAALPSAARRRATIPSISSGFSTPRRATERLVVDPASFEAVDADLPAAGERARRERAPRGRRRHRRLRHRPRTDPGDIRLGRNAVRRRSRERSMRTDSQPLPASSIRASTPTAGRSPTSQPANCGSPIAPPATGSSALTRPRTCRGARRSSSRPRRWAAPVATGGRQTAGACSPRGSTSPPSRPGGSPRRPIPTPPRARSASPGRQRQRRGGTLAVVTADGGDPVDGRLAPRRVRIPRRRQLGTASGTDPRRHDPRPADARRTDRRPGTGECTEVHRQTDPAWVELVAGAPRWIDDRLLTVADNGTRADRLSRR